MNARGLTVVVALGALSAAGLAAGAGYPIPVRSEPVVGTYLQGADPLWIDVVQGRGSTTFETRAAKTGDVRRQTVAGAFGMAQVGFGSGSIVEGYTRSGRVVVLPGVPLSYPPTSSRFAVLDSTGGRAPWQVRLPGWFDYDALSADGRTLFLVQHTDQTGDKYNVRAYDLVAKRLLPGAITDPRDKEVMQGYPQERVVSRDGRWVYTMYFSNNNGKHNFIHALDTVRRAATCTDLPASLRTDFNTHIALSGHGKIAVKRSSDALAAMVDPIGRTVALRTAASRP